MHRSIACLAVTAAFVSGAAAQPPAPPKSSEELAATLRGLMLRNMPTPLVQSNQNWGQQRLSPVGVKWTGSGLLKKPEVMKQMRNDGHWKKVWVEAVNPESTLLLSMSPVVTPEPGRSLFQAYIVCNARLHFEQQVWESGRRLYSGSTVARLRGHLAILCESTSRTENNGGLLPDLVFRVHALNAHLSYDNLVVEHTAGVGGDAARWLGETVHDLVNKVKPNLERDLLAKANAAIVKAADTKEVRISLSKFLPLAGGK